MGRRDKSHRFFNGFPSTRVLDRGPARSLRLEFIPYTNHDGQLSKRNLLDLCLRRFSFVLHSVSLASGSMEHRDMSVHVLDGPGLPEPIHQLRRMER